LIGRLRSIAFTVAFPLWTGLCCIVLAFGPLLPRKGALVLAVAWVRSVGWIERHVLGLRYRVIGRENLPRRGAFIVAAKHQSTYETMKLHVIFDDPAIVMKKELLRLPIWGAFTRKTGMIPIDRKAGPRALAELVSASRKAVAEGRPIVIFPQGTRVAPGQTRAYKSGVVALYQEFAIPIVPMAVDSGLFWPREGAKRGGTVTFSILPPIPPGHDPATVLKTLEERLESESDRLIAAGAPEPVSHPLGHTA
jgi:1-acyl-sn-glycerol-3-phosphate acyltransferase